MKIQEFSRGVKFRPARMRRTFIVLAVLVCAAAPAEAAQLDVGVVDGRVSLQATAVPLSELLATLDRVAGTESTVAAELRGRNVSVRFSNLELDDAIDKIFEGMGLNFIVVGGLRIMVTAVSGVPSENTGRASDAVAASGGVSTGSVAPPVAGVSPFQAPGIPVGGTGAPPAVIQTPFGPMVNPRAEAGGQEQPPAVQTPFGALVNPRAAAQGQERAPSTSPFSPNGIGTRSNGVPGQSVQPLFGNTSPPILDLNKQQQTNQPPVPGQPSPGIPTFPPPAGTP